MKNVRVKVKRNPKVNKNAVVSVVAAIVLMVFAVMGFGVLCKRNHKPVSVRTGFLYQTNQSRKNV